MSKDTIYIDVEDDITAIIGKVKNAKSKVVALVPPKRTGVLQSAVNLRLLSRAASQNGKHLVLISGNSALTALAASANIPSARTLQSKPELASLPKQFEENGEDIINGADLPVGDLARTAEGADAGGDAAALSTPAVESAIRSNAAEEQAPVFAAALNRKTQAARNKVNVPNFDTFRKKIAVGSAAGILLIGFLAWAIFFAPSAKIIITARTIESSANPKVTLAPNGTTDVATGTIKAVRQLLKKDATLTFDATGTKEVGDKAKGEVYFQNCESPDAVTVPSGTGISAGGKTYITQAAATVPGGQGNWLSGCIPGKSGAVMVVAQDIGEDYNVDKDTRFNVAGHSNSSSTSYFRAVASTNIDGGSKKDVTVVSKADIDKAVEQFVSENGDSMKKQLTEKFGSTAVPLDTTFSSDGSGVASTPAVDQEAPGGKAQLTGTVSFTMVGVEKKEIGTFLDGYFAKEIEKENNQRVYSNGADKANFIEIAPVESGAYSATMTATAKFGPKINDDQVKEEAKGKRYGEVQSQLEQISGVEDVDVKFSPFWVRTVPGDENRISIEFKLNDSK
jgi:hypothetical protein